MSSAGPSEPEVHRSSVVDPPPFNDIGALLDPEKSLHDIWLVIFLLMRSVLYFTTISHHLLFFPRHSLMGTNAGLTALG